MLLLVVEYRGTDAFGWTCDALQANVQRKEPGSSFNIVASCQQEVRLLKMLIFLDGMMVLGLCFLKLSFFFLTDECLTIYG